MTAASEDAASGGELDACSALRRQAKEVFSRRDYSDAVDLYSQALQEAGEAGAAQGAILCNRSLARYKLGQYAAAAADAEASLALDASSSKARYRAALAHLMLGRPQEAQVHVGALLESSISPNGGAGARDAAAAVASSPPLQTLPPYLCILGDAAAAQLAHHASMVQLAAMGFPSGDSSCMESLKPEARQVALLLSELSAELEGEADVDVGVLLAQLPPLLAASPQARAAFELGNGYPLALCYFTDAWHPLVAAMLRAASGWQPAQSVAEAGTAEHGSAGAVLWPAVVWHRLLSTVLGGAGSRTLAAAAMQLLAWVAGDRWARTQVLAHPLPTAPADSNDGGRSPLEQVVEALQRLSAPGLGPATIVAATELLSRFGEDAASAEALAQLRLCPLATLLHIYQQAEPLLEGVAAAAAAGAGRAAGATGGSATVDSSQLASEQEALEQLREKQRAVYNVQLVALRHAVLHALCVLCSCPELVAAEAPPLKAGSKAAGGGGSSQAEGFLPELVRVVRQLHEQSPKRTAAVLGPDGRPKAFAKRPFAADFRDNPAGDFLAGLDLESAAPDKPLDLFARPAPPSAAALSALSQQPAAPQTLVELGLTALLRIAGAGGRAAGQLYRLDALGLCEALWPYTSPAVVELAQRLCAALAGRHAAAASELMQEGGALGLASILQYTPLPASSTGACAATSEAAAAADSDAALRLVWQAADKVGALVDSCSGDEFAHLTLQPGGALQRAFELAYQQQPLGAAAAPPLAARLQSAAAQFVQLCCDRAQRQQGLQRWQCPRGGAWDRIGQPALQALLPQQAPPAAAVSEGAGSKAGSGKETVSGDQQSEGQAASSLEGLSKLKRGFLVAAAGKAERTKPGSNTSGRQSGSGAVPSIAPGANSEVQTEAGSTAQVQQASSGTTSAHAAVGNRDEVAAEEAAVHAAWEAQQAWLAYQAQQAEAEERVAAQDEGDVAELREVYDSTPSLAVRQARNAWMALPLGSKLCWDQTSTDVNVWVAVPAGTRARDVKVTVLPDRLTVGLGWYGRVVDGALHRRAKASEAQWCLEDNEVHVILPKDDRSYWKALFEGGEERSYYQLLQEAVQADEPATPYDEMDDHARQLLDNMLERQALINEGLIDPEGFDDFRVVVGENSLVQR